MSDTKHTRGVVLAARALCKHESEACGVNAGDNWRLYSEDFKERAAAMLNAIGHDDLVNAVVAARLHLNDEALPTKSQLIAMLDAAIAKATGSAA